MKKYIAGFLTCAILIFTLLTSGFAEGFTVLLNPYPIFFNGQQVQVEAYNVNGRTCIALGDVANLFGGTATINETAKQIEINSNKSTEFSITSTTEVLVPVIQFDIETEKPIGAEFTEYKGCRVLKYNAKYFVDPSDLYAKFGIIPTIVDENTRLFKLGDKKVIASRTDYNNTIKYKLTYLYNIELFLELIGE